MCGVHGADGGERRVARGDEHVGDGGESVELRLAGGPGLRRVDDLDHASLGLPHDDGVDEGAQRRRVREGERAPRDDERMASVPVPPARRESRRLEHADDAGDLELVRDAEGQDGVRVDGAHRLVRHRVLGGARRVPFALVVEEGPLAGDPRRLHQGAVDALVPEGAHPDGVGRRVAERDREGRLLGDPPRLVREALPDALAEGRGGHAP